MPGSVSDLRSERAEKRLLAGSPRSRTARMLTACTPVQGQSQNDECRKPRAASSAPGHARISERPPLGTCGPGRKAHETLMPGRVSRIPGPGTETVPENPHAFTRSVGPCSRRETAFCGRPPLGRAARLHHRPMNTGFMEKTRPPAKPRPGTGPDRTLREAALAGRCTDSLKRLGPR